MSPAELHADSIVIDGLIIAKWNRELFEDMRKGGLTAANCTVSVWEGFKATVDQIAASQKLIRDNSDLVMPVRTTADIRKAKELGKTGILFGFQNAHAFEDRSPMWTCSSSWAWASCRCATTPRTWWAPAATSVTAGCRASAARSWRK